MDLIDIVSKVIEISRKKEEFSEEVKNLRMCVLTIQDSVTKISHFGSISNKIQLFANIEQQLQEALKELEAMPKQMTIIQKTLSLLPGNLIQRIKDKTTLLLQTNSLLQTHLQTLILTNPEIGDTRWRKQPPKEKQKQKQKEKQKQKSEEQLQPTLQENALGATLQDNQLFKHQGFITVQLQVVGKKQVTEEFEKAGEPLQQRREIVFGKEQHEKEVFELGRSKIIFLQSKFPNQIKCVSKEHLSITLQKVNLDEVFQTCKEEVEASDLDHQRFRYVVRMNNKSSNGSYRFQKGNWRKVNKGQSVSLSAGDQFSLAMIKPANKQPLFSYRILLITQ